MDRICIDALLADPEGVGRLGEDLAARFLAERGAVVVAQNLRVGRGEVDLLVTFGGVPAAVEVKTSVVRHRDDDPVHRASEMKLGRVRSLAARLQPAVVRVDVVAVSLSEDGATIRWIPAAA